MSKTEQDPSNFLLLERYFSDIIVNVREHDGSGQPSTALCTRKTYVLKNETHLRISEYYTRKQKIDHYYYDWVKVSGGATVPILLFHSEDHEEPMYQTATEPYHIHSYEKTKLSNIDRHPNEIARDLHSVLWFIRLFDFAKEAID